MNRSVIRSTFCLFKGVSRSAEQRLWLDGCLTWEDFLRLTRPLFSRRKHLDICSQIEEANIAFSARLVDYFLNRLTGVHRSRICPEFRDITLFLDCETTGLGARDEITLITTYDGSNTRTYLTDRNLSDFLRELRDPKLLVTFNGSHFDLPRLQKRFKVDLAVPHLDLLPVVRAMGCRGTLKDCEIQLGLPPRENSLTGSDAVELWKDYSLTGNEKALRALIAYNHEDVWRLETILWKALRFSMSSFPFSWGFSGRTVRTPSSSRDL